jgi:hypothetical protein
MPKGVQALMESRMGADFRDVRVHTGGEAAQLNRSIGARAFTQGNDVYFGAGEYSPETDSGQHLLAHELTHTVQQSGPVNRRIQRNGDTASAVTTIIDALEGYTSAADSDTILNQFRGKGASTVADIMEGLKRRASEQGLSRSGMVDWLFEDVTAEDARELRQILIDARVSDVNRIVAIEVESLLSGYTSASNSREILGLLSRFSGSQLDNLLYLLEQQAEYSSRDMAEWLFDDLTTVDAERLRVHMLSAGGTRAANDYAAWYTAGKIEDLLAGYTSHADSDNIVANFERTPSGARSMVLYQLDVKTQERWGETAEDALMEDMDREDYEALAAMGGMRLRPYDYERSWLEGFLSGAEYVLIGVEYLVCGLVGIITGILSVIVDLVILVKDLGVAVYDILGMIVYFATGGAAGSTEWLAVKDFFRGLGRLFSQPGEVIAAAWEELTLEADLIEGPFTDCRRAEFWVRKIVNLIVNIILILAAGYGAIKGGASALKTVVQVLRQSGFRKGLVRLGGMVLTGTGSVLANLGDDVVRVLRAMARPVETLNIVRSRLNVIKLAAADEGYWQFLRRQAGSRVAAERAFWDEQRGFWSTAAEGQETRLTELDDTVRGLMDDIEGNRMPSNADDIVDDVERGSKSLQDDVDDLNNRITREAPERAPGRQQGEGPSTPRSEIDTLTIETRRLGDGHEIKVLGDGRIFLCTDPCTEITNLGADLARFQSLVDAGLDSHRLVRALKNFSAGEGGATLDEVMNALRALHARGGAQRTTVNTLLDELEAGGARAADASTFLDRVTRIRTVEGVEFTLDELYAAYRRGDAILDHGPLQTPEFPDKPHRLEGNRFILEESPTGNPAKQITKQWNRTVDFVIVDEGGGNLRIILGRNHSGLSSGAPSVYGAGELLLDKRGYVQAITNRSGHYLPSTENLQRAKQWLVDNGYIDASVAIRPQ